MRRQIHRRFLRLRGHLYSLYAEPGRTAGLQRFFSVLFLFWKKTHGRVYWSFLWKFSAFHLSNQRESAGFYQWKLHSLYLTEIKVTWCCHHSSHHQPLLREKLHGLFLPSWSYDIHLPDIPLHEESFQWKQAVWLWSSLFFWNPDPLPQFWAQADVQSELLPAFSFHDGRALAALRVFFQCVHDCWIFFDGFLIVMTEWRNFHNHGSTVPEVSYSVPLFFPADPLAHCFHGAVQRPQTMPDHGVVLRQSAFF